jgi:peptide/nickel transport system permease protein
MLKLAARRILASIPLIIAVSLVSFLFEGLIPGNAAQAILGPNASPGAVVQLNQQLGLNKPLYEQYWQWLDHLLHGSLGDSLANGQSVFSELNTRLPVTVSLLAAAIVIAIVLGCGAGLFSALRGGTVGKIVDVLAVPGLAVPSFWLALLLIAGFAVTRQLFPATGYTPFTQSPSAWIDSLVLPALALGLGQMTMLAKQTRDSMLEVLGRPYILSLRANGINERKIIYKHALRSAAIPVVTVAGLLVIGALTGAVVIEQIFVLPGLGSLAVSATGNHDLPVVQGVALYFTLIVVVVNLLVDLAYGWLDPKVRTA